MYRCSECGSEFEIKPEYCDCGNDVFKEVIEKKPEPAIEQKPKSEEKKEEKTPVLNQNIQNFNNKFVPPPKIEISRQELISRVIFGILLMLSFYVVFFAWNSKLTADNVQIKEKEDVKTVQIPSIDKFWDNTPPKPKQTIVSERNEDAVVNVIEEITQKIIQEPKKVVTIPKQTTVPKKIEVKVVKPVQKQDVQTKPVQKTSTVKTPQKTVTQQVKKEETKPQIQQKTTDDIEARAIAAAAEARKKAQAKQDFLNYKAELRNKIARNIDFTKVVGDGKCAISFKISPSGKLTNASFSIQSPNITLNDAVYNAFMSSLNYKIPPEIYNNETLTLSVNFYNGNYEISLP